MKYMYLLNIKLELLYIFIEFIILIIFFYKYILINSDRAVIYTSYNLVVF